MACLQNDSPIVRLDGRELPVRVRRHPRARRMTLRVAPRGEALSLVLPKGVRLREGLNFLRGQEAWIKAQLDAMPRPVPFADGACLPILGTTVVILHCPQAARGVWREEDRICVSGRAEHLPRRTREFLVHLASEEISSRAREKAKTLGHKVASIRLRDTKSRWGSCSSRGDLAFSWRLIFAPEMVLDYVVAHEVAHLEEMNHSPRFWAIAETLTGDLKSARRWLKGNGAGLMRYGQ